MLDQEIGARIRRQRKALKMSQTTLGLAAGISYQQVVKYEKGDNRTHPVELVAFVHRLVIIGCAQSIGSSSEKFPREAPGSV